MKPLASTPADFGDSDVAPRIGETVNHCLQRRTVGEQAPDVRMALDPAEAVEHELSAVASSWS